VGGCVCVCCGLDCDVNCHRKCEKLMPNLCGVNQKLVVEALATLKRGNPNQIPMLNLYYNIVYNIILSAKRKRIKFSTFSFYLCCCPHRLELQKHDVYFLFTLSNYCNLQKLKYISPCEFKSI